MIEHLVRKVAKYFIFLAVVITIAWVVFSAAAHWLKAAKWSPDGLDFVRVAAALYLTELFSKLVRSWASAMLTICKWFDP